MSMLNKSIRESLEGRGLESINIFGSTGGSMSAKLNDAISRQLGEISAQEEVLDKIRQERSETPFTKRMGDIISAEKTRITALQSDLNGTAVSE